MNKFETGKTLLTVILISSIFFCEMVTGQDTTYYPKGNPKKWNFELTPFLWIPWTSGNIRSTYVSENFDVAAIDLLTNLKMAFMVNAEVSKGKFFAAPSYIYTRVGSEQVRHTDNKGNDALVAARELTLNVAELIVGTRVPVSKKFLIDAFLGCRYDHFKASIVAEGKFDTTNVAETTDFWDPVIGFRANYFPHPRVPLSLRVDFGGLDIGSNYSWTASFTGGYSVSPLIDLIVGFNAYGFEYGAKTDKDKNVGLTMVLYGFDIGLRLHFPSRVKDPATFRKFK
ncbi:MAG: hypothetical protein NTW10_11495 [Bacteroidetes bacterium]|nr:hypothetical protein [Bacteroidota bacterium]